MTKKKEAIYRRIVPGSIFGRIFWGIFLVTILSLFIIWIWFYNRFYVSLNQEAEARLRKMAESMAQELELVDDSAENTNQKQAQILSSLWRFEKSGGWIQNMYWLDVEGEKPSFIASFSANNDEQKSMQPPTPEEAEDLVFAFINELENGNPVMPDPFSFGVSRRYKIVLYPILDHDKMLASVIGIEADMQYLNLAMQLRQFFIEILVASLLLSFFMALILAQNLSKKTRFLLGRLKTINKGVIPENADLHVQELNELNDGLINLAREIKESDEHLHELFARKLEELSFTGGVIAHEIRNPLSAIEMHFGLLKRQLNSENSGDIASVAEITEQLAHLRTLIDSFLTYTRKVTPQREGIRLNDFVNSILQSRKTMNEKLHFATEIPVEMVVQFDRTMLQQICENIINNSIEACEGTELQFKIFAEARARDWVLTFANNGPPIPKSVQERLFTPFVTSKADGHGIGLALVRKLVEAHNGEINCNSSDSGVTFVIEVPYS